MPLRRAGTVPNTGAWYGPGSAAHRYARLRAALRPGHELNLPAFLFRNPARGHRSFTIPVYGESRLKCVSLRPLCCVGVEFALRKELRVQRMRRRMMLVAMVVLGPVALVPRMASAEGLFDFFFSPQKQQAAPGTGASQFLCRSVRPQPAARAAAAPVATAGSGPAFCVRSCDGKYFPVSTRGGATPVQMCQAFCPASATKVFFGSSIDGASSSTGERYADSENAFAYRKALRADCTCNGRDPAGLAPVDLTLDSSLRAGDVIATTSGLVAYTGVRLGANQTADFTPVASYPGLTADVRARLGEMKVAPVIAETVASDAPLADLSRDVLPVTVVPKASSARAKRAEVN